MRDLNVHDVMEELQQYDVNQVSITLKKRRPWEIRDEQMLSICLKIYKKQLKKRR